MSSEIYKLRKQIEKLVDSMRGKENDFKITKKKELLNLYKKLFTKKMMSNNKMNLYGIRMIVEDLMDAGWTIQSWFKKEKKLSNTYYKLAVNNAKTLEEFLRLGELFSMHYQYRLGKKVLDKSIPLVRTFEEKWKLGKSYIHLNRSAYGKIGQKICLDALEEDKKEKKEMRKRMNLDLMGF